MNKRELTIKVAKQTGLTAAVATRSIDAVFAAIKESVEAGGCASIKGFGSFSVSERSERSGINPATKQPIRIPARRVMKFRPSKSIVIK